MNLLAIDPGNEQTAYVVFDSEARRLIEFGKIPNAETLTLVDAIAQRHHVMVDHIAIEMIASYGMPVGREVFETCVWIGRMLQALAASLGIRHTLVYRRDVKLHICGQARAKDPNVRAALIDKFGPGKDKAIGKRASPGPLFGVTADVWAALAVAVTYAEGGASAR